MRGIERGRTVLPGGRGRRLHADTGRFSRTGLVCASVQGAAREKEGGADWGERGSAGGGQRSGEGRARRHGLQVYLAHKNPPSLYDPVVALCLGTNGDPMGSERFV